MGFYYDAFYGELSLNEDHFKQIEAGAAKAVAICSGILVESVRASFQIGFSSGIRPVTQQWYRSLALSGFGSFGFLVVRNNPSGFPLRYIG
ncbi:hypothetical protein OROGR_008662 [Orobanche gracilis]